MPPDVLPLEETPSPSPVVETPPDAVTPDWRTLLDTVDPDELFQHPKIRSTHQSRKDRELHQVREQVRQEFAAQEQARYNAWQRENEERQLESLPDEELGRELRVRRERDKDQMAMQQREQAIRDDALRGYYEEGYQKVFSRVGSEIWNNIVSRAGQGEFNTYDEVVAAAIDLKAQELAEDRATPRAQELAERRLADVHLQEPVPDLGGVTGSTGAPRLRRSQIRGWSAAEHIANAHLLDAAEEAGTHIND